MFASLLSKKKRLIQRLWKMRRSYLCRDYSSTKYFDESCEILHKIFAEYYAKDDNFLEKFDAKELFFDVLNHLTTENLEILSEELSSNDGKVCPCITIHDAEFSKKSKILSKKLSRSDSLRLVKHLLFHFFVLDLKNTKMKLNVDKRRLVDQDSACDTKNLLFMTLPWCSCDKSDSGCVNPFHVALSHPDNEETLFKCDGETIESDEIENDLHSVDYNDAIHQLSSSSIPCVYYLAYWERATKVSNSVAIDNPLLFCFNKGSSSRSKKRTTSLHFAQYCDLCSPTTSASIANENDDKPPSNDLCRTIRQKIGRGFALFIAPTDRISNPKEALAFSYDQYSTYHGDHDTAKKPWCRGDFVVLHNRGPLTLYVQSNFLTEISDEERTVKNNNRAGRFLKSRRLLPGQAIIVQRIGFSKNSINDSNKNDLAEPESASVLISFSKCWGHDQKRHLITYCPCWVEVVFPVR